MVALGHGFVLLVLVNIHKKTACRYSALNQRNQRFGCQPIYMLDLREKQAWRRNVLQRRCYSNIKTKALFLF